MIDFPPKTLIVFLTSDGVRNHSPHGKEANHDTRIVGKKQKPDQICSTRSSKRQGFNRSIGSIWHALNPDRSVGCGLFCRGIDRHRRASCSDQRLDFSGNRRMRSKNISASMLEIVPIRHGSRARARVKVRHPAFLGEPEPETSVGQEISKAGVGVILCAGALIGLGGFLFFIGGLLTSDGITGFVKGWLTAFTGI